MNSQMLLKGMGFANAYFLAFGDAQNFKIPESPPKELEIPAFQNSQTETEIPLIVIAP